MHLPELPVRYVFLFYSLQTCDKINIAYDLEVLLLKCVLMYLNSVSEWFFGRAVVPLWSSCLSTSGLTKS